MSKTRIPSEKIFVKLNDSRPTRPSYEDNGKKGTVMQWKSIKDPEVPSVILSQIAYRKMMYWTVYASERYNRETSGLGTVLVKHKGLFVSDVYLIEPEQKGAGHVEQDPVAVGKLMRELYMGTGEMRFSLKTDEFLGYVGGRNPRNLRLLWHTHNNFAVGWSGRDDRTAKYEFCADSDWTINICANAKGHFLARIDHPKTWNPVCPNVECDMHEQTQMIPPHGGVCCKCKAQLPKPMQPTNGLPVYLLQMIPGKLVNKYKEEYDRKHEPVVIMEDKSELGMCDVLPEDFGVLR